MLAVFYLINLFHKQQFKKKKMIHIYSGKKNFNTTSKQFKILGNNNKVMNKRLYK